MEAKKEHGLLFQPDMAPANVAGLKTMTRRGLRARGKQGEWLTSELIQAAPSARVAHVDGILGAQLEHPRGGPLGWLKCPWQVGDLIYQKERWRVGSVDRNTIWYDDNTARVLPDTADNLAGKFLGGKNKSSLFMPKWAARFWAEIVSIKVERVRDISESDALKEGVRQYVHGHEGEVLYRVDPVTEYRALYDRINGPGSFDRDWCWVIEYRRVER